MSEKKAIVIGASSGIGRELVKILAANGYTVGITSRRLDLLNELQKEISGQIFVQTMDVVNTSQAIHDLHSLIQKMDGVDLIVINAGIISYNPQLDWDKDKATIETNVLGFCAMANAAMKYFISKQSGHLVGISSIAALRGWDIPAYSASKAFVSNYLEGLMRKAVKENLPITVTDIKPGYIDTAMTKTNPHTFWMVSPHKAAEEIFKAIKNQKRHAYIPKRWRLIAWAMKFAPDWIYDRT